MPLDPSIALNVRPPEINPMQTLGQLYQLKGQADQNKQQQIQNEQRQRAQEDDDAMRTALQGSDDPEDAVKHLLSSGHGTAAATLTKNLYDWREAKAKELKSSTDNAHNQAKLLTQIGQSVTDEPTFQAAKRVALKIGGQQVADAMGDTFDPVHMKALVAAGTETTAWAKQQADAAAAIQSAHASARDDVAATDTHNAAVGTARDKWTNAASVQMGTARNQAEWDRGINILTMGGAPKDVIASFGTQFSPQAVKNAKALGMTQAQAATVADQNANRSLAARNTAVSEAREKRETDNDALARINGTGPLAKGISATRASEINETAAKAYKELQDKVNADYPNKATIPPEKLAELADSKLAIEDGRRSSLGQPPLMKTEANLVQDPSKRADLLKIRRVIKSVTGNASPIEEMEEIARKISIEKDPARKKVLQDAQRQKVADYDAKYGGQ